MSTRAAIAFKTEEGWSGVYSHWDGYPTSLGARIWDTIMKEFILNKGEIGIANDGSRSLQSFVDVYIKGHRGGWSSFPETCYCHDPEFVMRDGDKTQEEFMDQDHSDPLFIEWVYIIDPDMKTLTVLTHGRSKGLEHNKVVDKKTGEVRKWDSPKYAHYPVVVLSLNPDIAEPNWEAIEKKGGEISEQMSKKFETRYGRSI